MFISSLSKRLGVTACTALLLVGISAQAATSLADKPVFASVSVPGNLALALSVEFPTAVSNAHLDTTYAPTSTYLGYFDPDKCYDYRRADPAAGKVNLDHFAPAAMATGHVCSNKWSGNFLNWATMQTIDPFRWALTGGYRVVDETYATVIEKAYASGQGGTGNFPDRSLTDATVIAGATPLGWGGLRLRIQGMGVQLRFTRQGDNNSGNPVSFNPAGSPWADNISYVVSARARVCDTTLGAAFRESNCKLYDNGSYKPEGLIQQYANQIRFSAFGYLNDGSLSRDGGVLRARQKFVGPTKPVPGSDPTDNGLKEWDPATGIMRINPDPDDAKAFGVALSNSGVMNYLNKFGAAAGTYKTYDPVGELFYTVLRYYRNVGNVPEYTDGGSASANTKTAWADGFPVITDWDDPIQYSCQKNFILGIGDVNTHADRNLPGSTGSSEPAKPAVVSADTAFDATTWTSMVGTMSNLSNLASTSPYNGCCTNNGALMAGMAYWANTSDIRPTGDPLKTTGVQTVQTYWLDVLEQSTYKKNNQYYLATKYGGANLPSDFNPVGRTADLTQSWWHTGPSSDTVGGQLRPDTYYTAARPDLMVSGLSSAFASIASRMKGYSTALATAQPQITTAGVANYAAQYDASTWSGEVVASTLSFNPADGKVSSSDSWRFSDKLAAQAAGTGWDTSRFMVTVNSSTRAAVPFRLASISSAQSSALDTAYRSGADTQDYLNYLRGDRSQEQSSVVTGSSKAYRNRTSLVGDIVNAKLTVVGPPSLSLSEVSNPGYAAYKTAKANRPNYVVAATNQGVVHVIDGSLTGTTAGKELFAYVPSPVFSGPNGTPAVNGLQSIGNPNFSHYYMVDAQAVAMDVDFGRTVGGTGTDWRSIVVGGMGKGGRSIYALDLTNLSDINSEAVAATKVLWEFTDTDMGFTFGQPLVTRMAQYGWVVIVPAGHNNATGKNHLYILNPRTGALLARIDTPVGTAADQDDGTAANPSGMTQVTAFYPDIQSALAESVYAGDLRGSVWRFDLRTAPVFPTPVKVARATDSTGAIQPITTHVLPVVQLTSNRRFVVFGSGKLLDASDITNAQVQRMYAVADGRSGTFNTAADLPAGVSFPVTSAKLHQLTDLTRPVVIDYNVEMGWYMNVATGYRVINDPAYFGGTVAFAATLPSSADPCSPSGSSIVYAIDLGTGQSRFANNATYFDPGSAVTDVQFVETDGKPTLIVSVDRKCTGDSCNPNCSGNLCAPPVPPPNGVGPKLLNWREVPLRNATGGTL
nr:PilC/PilY family type IV pilus protein [uncultured Roseateles sp.]